LDIVQWFDKDESRQMRYSPSTLQFFWLGRKLFGGRFIRFMSGPKNESDIPILSSRLKKETFCRSAVKFPSSLVKKLRRIGVETRLKVYKYFEIERDFL
jgi:hypothetical protein